jgi:SynChlorMet cassette protein ScmC
MKITMINNEEKCRNYGVRLLDGSAWGFTGYGKAIPPLDTFARMNGMIEVDETWPCVAKFSFMSTKSADELIPRQLAQGLDIDIINNYGRIWSCPLFKDIFIELIHTHHDVGGTGVDIMRMSNAWKIIHKHYIFKGGTFFHAASAALNGRGMLITAPSSTGKTTSFRRLPNYWEKFSDDLVLVIKNKNGIYNMHGLPTWSEYIVNKRKPVFHVERYVPLYAIFFLEQSDEDKVEKIKPTQAAIEIYETLKFHSKGFLLKIKSLEKKEIHKNLFDTSINLAKSIKCYRLKATLHGEFWKEIEKVL